uniref:Peptidase M12B domain-containing protein n=1 Tax=Strigamia maritima TaxID=126957 RepID=T1IWV1_STRMM
VNLEDSLTSGAKTITGTDSTGTFNIPQNFELVHPFVIDHSGNIISPLNSNTFTSHIEDLSKSPRNTRHIRRKNHLVAIIDDQNQRLILNLKPQRKLIAKGIVIQWIPMDDDNEDKVRMRRSVGQDCIYVGRVHREKNSRVAVDVCNGMTGLIQTATAAYFIQPLSIESKNFSHAFYPINSSALHRSASLADDQWRPHGNNILTSSVQSKELSPTTDKVIKEKYLSVAVAADHTVVGFHGHKVEEFILMLMNIVNAIYSDPSLGAKLTITVTRILLFKSKEESRVFEGNPRISLENVCNWFKYLNVHTTSNRRHDIGVYLTRLDIGGPTGYAPVGGMCNHRRSCTLNRDEGLTSAFTIAHEIGHVLGFTHDGDHAEGNSCTDDGSIMAPLVLATFNRFHWSNCTRQEYRNKINKWFCLSNKPLGAYPLPTIATPLGRDYTLDDQCRLEFGEGFYLCRSFLLSDPCTHLWCSNISTPLLCKTKKGPPLEGTPCGKGKWCVKGYCQHINKKKSFWDPIRRNPQHGGWGEWSRFLDCSRTCGGGVHFRTRKCSNPKPAFGGKQCEGPTEEFEMCNIQNCPRKKDFRAEQCTNLAKLIKLDHKLSKLSWTPFSSNNESSLCSLTCMAEKNGQTFISNGENVIDGTLCSYDIPSHICVQGQCQVLGCDSVLGSSITEDRCGICGGNGSLCRNIQKLMVKTPRKVQTRIIIVPKGARNIEVREVSGTTNFLVLKNRKNGKIILNGKKVSESSKSVVTEGAKFVYTRCNESETLTAKGPLLGEIVLLATPIIKGVRMMITVNFTIPLKLNLDDLNQEEMYIWDYAKWSRCSHDCGGGFQFSRVICIEKSTRELVKKRLCNAKAKPNIQKRPCNTFSCTYRWRTQEWEHCDHTCGWRGIQHRHVFCTPVNETSTVVVPKLCPDGRPDEYQPCNRVPCQQTWTVGEWSPCSSTCGIGVQYRNVTCIAPKDEILFECNDEKVETIRECTRSPCDNTNVCLEDASEFCQMQVLHRYCQIPSYFKLCCQSCNNQTTPPRFK